jgi:hypothetical protein
LLYNHTLTLTLLFRQTMSVIIAARTTQQRKHSLGADLQKTLACVTSIVWRHRSRISCGRYTATAVRVTYRDTLSIVACDHYLATADVYRITSQQQYIPALSQLNCHWNVSQINL